MNKRIMDDLTNFIFIEDEMEKADVIFIPGGSHPDAAEEAARLWKKAMAPYLVPSGKSSIKTGVFSGVKSKAEIYNTEYHTECEFLTDVLVRNGVDPEAVLGEPEATFTKENAVFSRRLLDQHKIDVKKGIICCKNFHARRCLMYYQFAFPNAELLIRPVPYLDHGVMINKENWYKSQQGIKRVFGEIERVGTQFLQDFEQQREES